MTQQRIEHSGLVFHHDGDDGAPRDPRPLRWPDEPGFAAAVSSIVDKGATSVVINIKSNRTYAVDGDLGTQLEKVAFELGGGTAHSGATSLHIRASFPQTRKGWK